MGYGLGIVSGQPPRDLYLQMSIGVRGTASSGKARLWFDDQEQFLVGTPDRGPHANTRAS
jgi:hypothetical protein